MDIFCPWKLTLNDIDLEMTFTFLLALVEI